VVQEASASVAEPSHMNYHVSGDGDARVARFLQQNVWRVDEWSDVCAKGADSGELAM
jgi:hypothetical protein